MELNPLSPLQISQTPETEGAGPLDPQRAANLGASTDQPALIKAAQEFEALLIHSLLKSINESSGEGGWLEGDTMGDWGLQAVSTAMASSGGFGLANRILEQLGQAPADVSKSVTAVADSET